MSEAREPFSWVAFFELAETLAKNDDEASLRTAVSRSYYAVYNGARLLLEELDPDFSAHRTQESHSQVWERVSSLPQRQAKSICRKGRSLRAKRVSADYEANAGHWSQNSDSALSEACSALNAIEDLLSRHGQS
ncbi:hypothetical protein G6O69_08125 [Pseudenhygromyxa sp. WMMC2535]|uniref:hypothetical protein n=1 Tax=Pseudenhygromyxa sp. WMMC2535 TaxID=2712867 RepID=UPI001551EFFF|nr:hypothetical protein [Pseudenhygromyxa sp. WMMC2535]NVB37797.1 hypothetical protein [Pseudenhygromyxa sp. WMMC2535]